MRPSLTHPRLDLVVYGATGFTGQLVCQYLRRHAPSGLRWALAGRDASKLDAVAAACEALPGLNAGSGAAPTGIIGGCSAIDGSAAMRICGEARPRVVLSTAGPFVHHSDALVHACAGAGVSYVDIDGEIPWVARVIERDDSAARASGALIVPNCGFDSVPSDLGALRSTELLAAKTTSPCVSVHTVMHMVGVMSGGTIETGIEIERLFPDEVGQPFRLGGAEHLARGRSDVCDVDPAEARYDSFCRRWLAPFGMARINSRVVRRSAGVLGAYVNVDPTRFRYREEQLAPAGARAAAKMSSNASIPSEKLKSLRAAGRLPKPGEGPSAEKRAASSFVALCIARAADGATATTSLSGGDPGYDETAKMVSEAALTILTESHERLPCRGRGGVLTPAAALGESLARRLIAAGMARRDELEPTALPGEPDVEAEATALTVELAVKDAW